MALTEEQFKLRDEVASEFRLKEKNLETFQQLVSLNHDFSPGADETFDSIRLKLTVDNPASLAFSNYQHRWMEHLKEQGQI